MPSPFPKTALILFALAHQAPPAYAVAQVPRAAAQQRTHVVAVLQPSVNEQVDAAGRSAVRGALEGAIGGKCKAVERGALDKALGGLLPKRQLDAGGMIDEKTTKRLGSACGADYLLASDIFKDGDYMNLTCWLVDVATGATETDNDYVEHDTPQEICRVVEKLAATLLPGNQKPPSAAPPASAQQEATMSAAIAPDAQLGLGLGAAASVLSAGASVIGAAAPAVAATAGAGSGVASEEPVRADQTTALPLAGSEGEPQEPKETSEPDETKEPSETEEPSETQEPDAPKASDSPEVAESPEAPEEPESPKEQAPADAEGAPAAPEAAPAGAGPSPAIASAKETVERLRPAFEFEVGEWPATCAHTEGTRVAAQQIQAVLGKRAETGFALVAEIAEGRLRASSKYAYRGEDFKLAHTKLTVTIDGEKAASALAPTKNVVSPAAGLEEAELKDIAVLRFMASKPTGQVGIKIEGGDGRAMEITLHPKLHAAIVQTVELLDAMELLAQIDGTQETAEN